MILDIEWTRECNLKIYGTACYQGESFESKIEEKLELAYKKIKEKLDDEKHKIESCTENKFFHKDIIL